MKCKARHAAVGSIETDLGPGDEKRPVCGNCAKSERTCRPSGQGGTTFRNYIPRERRRGSIASETAQQRHGQTSYDSQACQLEDCNTPRSIAAPELAVESVDGQQDAMPSPLFANQPNSTATVVPVSHLTPSNASISISQLLQPDPESPIQTTTSWASSPSHQSSAGRVLSSDEARFVHHYAMHLGRWLDCTDASRQFSLKMPALVTASPILLEAIISISARHMRDTQAADAAYDRCIGMLIVLLGSDDICHDDVLLCAIVILRVFEQLTGWSTCWLYTTRP